MEDGVLRPSLPGKRGGTLRRPGARNSVGLVGVEGALSLLWELSSGRENFYRRTIARSPMEHHTEFKGYLLLTLP